MNVAFIITAAVAVVATALALTRSNAVHGLLYLVLSLLAVAVILYLAGAPFIAALEVIIYAGAIIVLFLFVAMLVSLDPRGIAEERRYLRPTVLAAPALLAALLVAEIIWTLARGSGPAAGTPPTISPQDVGRSLFGPYLLGVELVSMLLLGAAVGAFHLGRRATSDTAGDHAESHVESHEQGHGPTRGADPTAAKGKVSA